MERAIEEFRRNLRQVRHLGEIYRGLEPLTTDAIDLSDILRMELVLVVSALDRYIHEIVRLGIIEAYRGERERTKSFYERFSIPVKSILQSTMDPNELNWLEDAIRERFGYQSFQKADRIAQAIRFVSDVKLWEAVVEQLGYARSADAEDPKKKLKEDLDLIVDRRNKIVHEADVDPTSLNTRKPIDESYVEESVQFIERIAEAIYKIIAQ